MVYSKELFEESLIEILFPELWSGLREPTRGSEIIGDEQCKRPLPLTA